MRSVSQIYGIEKTAFIGAASKALLRGARALPNYLGTGARTVGKYTGVQPIYSGTKKAIKRIPSNLSKSMANMSMGEKALTVGSGLAVANAIPFRPVQRATGLDNNMLLSMLTDFTAGGRNFGKESRQLMQNMKMGQTSAAPIRKFAGDKMYKHKEIIKQASKRNLAQYAAAGLGIGVGAPLAMYGIGKAVKATQSRTLNRDYQKVVKEDPSLKNEKAKKLYGVLHRTAPQVAREPLVASKVLKNMMEIPQITPQTFSDVLRLESLYQQTEMPYYGIKHQMKPGDI